MTSELPDNRPPVTRAAHDASLELLTPSGGVLAIVFAWRGDRHGHTVYWRGAKDNEKLFESVEGRSSDVWPPSPPLQQLHLEERGAANRVLLLVGMAGAGHWSLAVECDQRDQRITFDAACRCPSPPVWLGSTYTGLPTEQSDAARLECRVDERHILEWTADRSAATATQLVAAPSGFAWQPAETETTRWPTTLRWRYELRVRSA